MSDPRLEAIRTLIQEDVGNRGLRTDPADNLITRTTGDFEAACRSIAEHPAPSVCVVTGFFIPHGQPPACETDGPLGAVFFARALVPLGIQVLIFTDPVCRDAIGVGLQTCGLAWPSVRSHLSADLPPAESGQGARPVASVLTVPPKDFPWDLFLTEDWRQICRVVNLTHLIALERVGPSHTPESVWGHPESTPAHGEAFQRHIPPERHGCCYTMKGRDITAHMNPAHLLFDAAREMPDLATIGIGDGGNEIGMGKLPWDVIRRNIPNGGLTACRVPCDHLIVAGVSNWGAYGLAAGVRLLRGAPFDPELFDVERERELLRVMVEAGPLVDGVTGRPTVSVDGLDFDRYAEPLRRMAALLR